MTTSSPLGVRQPEGACSGPFATTGELYNVGSRKLVLRERSVIVVHVLFLFTKYVRYRKVNIVGAASSELVYADLVATADARNIETAQIIRERLLTKD